MEPRETEFGELRTRVERDVKRNVTWSETRQREVNWETGRRPVVSKKEQGSKASEGGGLLEQTTKRVKTSGNE